MLQRRIANKQTWFRSLTVKLTTLTGILVGCAAAINGGIDLWRTMFRIPVGEQAVSDDAAFRRNFGKSPLVEQPVTIATFDKNVPMLLRVFPSGDLYVSYGNIVRWLPFKPNKISSVSVFSEAQAQTATTTQENVVLSPVTQRQLSVYIDLDKLKAEEARGGIVAPNGANIEKNYVIAEMKEDHPYLFERSAKDYSKKILAEPGYKFKSFDFLLGTSSHYSAGKTEIVDNGNAIVTSFRLRSGSAVNRYPGWIQGTLRTRQYREN